MSLIKQDNEFVKMEYQESVESVRKGLELLIQIETALGLAQVSVLGYTITSNKALFFWIGAVITYLMFKALKAGFTWLNPIMNRARLIESKMIDNKQGFVSMATSYAFEHPLAVSRLSNGKILVELPGDKNVRMFFLGITFLQVIAPFLVHFILKWNWF